MCPDALWHFLVLWVLMRNSLKLFYMFWSRIRSFVYAAMLTSCADEVCADPVLLHQSLNFYCAFYSKIHFKVVNKSVFVL